MVREVYDRLLPELRARAFTISGIESADILRTARRVIATVPQGGDWGEAKAQLEDALKPWLGGGAERRAELLLRHHAFQAYAAANVRFLLENTDIFPYWKYQTAKDEKVRDTHAALDGVVLPWDSPFWERHTPPWAWGCRCDVVGISAEEADRLRKADARKAPERRRVLDGAVREQLEGEGKLVRGVNEIYDLRTPSERGETGGPDWSPGELRLPLEMLRKRYADDPETWRAFEAWAQAQEIPEAEIEDGDGPATVWEWLAGARLRRARFRSPLLPDPEGGGMNRRHG